MTPKSRGDLQYWKDQTERKIREILIIHDGKLSLADLIIELAREGYNVYELGPLLPKFSSIVIENNTVSLRKKQKRIPRPPPQTPTKTLTSTLELGGRH